MAGKGFQVICRVCGAVNEPSLGAKCFSGFMLTKKLPAEKALIIFGEYLGKKER